MSIKTMNMYTVLCDGCGKDVMEGSEFSGWGEVWMAFEETEGADWLNENGEGCTNESKHYCPDCYFYDDEDKFQLKPREARP